MVDYLLQRYAHLTRNTRITSLLSLNPCPYLVVILTVRVATWETYALTRPGHCRPFTAFPLLLLLLQPDLLIGRNRVNGRTREARRAQSPRPYPVLISTQGKPLTRLSTLLWC